MIAVMNSNQIARISDHSLLAAHQSLLIDENLYHIRLLIMNFLRCCCDYCISYFVLSFDGLYSTSSKAVEQSVGHDAGHFIV